MGVIFARNPTSEPGFAASRFPLDYNAPMVGLCVALWGGWEFAGRFACSAPPVSMWVAPFWFWLVTTGALPTAMVIEWARKIFRRRRCSAGFCPSCNYNLTGNASGVCPECGRSVRKGS